MITVLSLAGHGHARQSHRIAQRAEQAGFAAVLFRPTDARPAKDPLPLMASTIAPTGRIGLGATLPMSGALPFNAARTFATLDRLSNGRAAWVALPEPMPPAESGRAMEFAEVVSKLWDSWEDEAFLVDKASGRFADPERVHRIDHEAAWFKVRGPLNVPRPIQGQPVIVVVDPIQELARAAVAHFADLVITQDGTEAGAHAARASLRGHAAACGRAQMPLVVAGLPVPAADMQHWGQSGACDGFDFAPTTEAELEAAFAFARRQPPNEGMTLRERLGLVRPRNRYAAA